MRWIQGSNEPAQRARPGGRLPHRPSDHAARRQGHQLRHRRARHRRAGRRIGQRQIGDGARHHGPAAARERARAPCEPHRLPRAQSARAPRPRAAGAARRRDLDDLPGADELAEPGVHGRVPDRGSAEAAPRPARVAGAAARAPAARRGRPRRAAGQARRLPVPALRRRAAARDDRHGDRLRAEAADRRRADHRLGRHCTEADPGADRRPAGAAPDVGAVHHARPVARRRDRRRGGGDARRPDPRAGAGRTDLLRPPGPLYSGAACLPPTSRSPAAAPAGHR